MFEKIVLDHSIAAAELTAYKTFLDENAEFKERMVVAELKKLPHLCCLIGSLNAGVPRADVYKFEFTIQGAFRADFVAGNLQVKKFVLVEFEGAIGNSLFGPSETNQMRDWSRQLEHGFGQLVDWSWALHDSSHTTVLKNAFECDDFSTSSLLVCGRDSEMNSTEGKRFGWRCDKISLEGRPTTILTYDGLYRYFQGTLEAIRSFNDVA